MENDYNVTIPLSMYNDLIRSEYQLEQVSDMLMEAIKDIEVLHWEKKELEAPQYLIPIFKMLCGYEYNAKVQELKRKEQ